MPASRAQRQLSVGSAMRDALSHLRVAWDEIARSVWPSASDGWLVAAQLEFYRRSTRHSGLIMAAACLGVSQACSSWVSASTRWTWGLSAALVILAIYAVGTYYSRFPVNTLSEIRAAALRQTVLVTIYAFTWCSMSAFLWAPDQPVNHMVLVLVLAVSLAGSITVSATHPATAAVIVGVHALFLIAPPALSSSSLDHTMAALSVAFVLLLTTQTVVLYTSTRKLLALEYERSDLVEDLRLAKQDSDRERAHAVAAGRAKSQFLSNMSHELRTPMNAILGFSELIKQKAFGTAVDRYAEYAEIIHQSGQHLLRLIDDMLDLAKIEGGKLSLRENELSLTGVLGDVFAENEAIAAEARLSLLKKVPPGLPRVYADERALRQIVANLLSNAIRFTAAGGCVTLFARLEEDGRIAFGVDDTGVGICEEDQAHVFERFGHGRHDVTSADKGTGLGLAIVKGFAEAHDGQVKLESALGVGTRVTAYLPAERVLTTATRKAV